MAILMEEAGLGSRSAFKLDATQAHLADALGLTPVHVNRTLKALKEAGVVRIGGRTVHIGGWDALANAAISAPPTSISGGAHRRCNGGSSPPG
jgi:DNA-binding transcriptional ArsR family regulator